MTAAPDLDRKVRRMENDVSAIYEMLASIQLVQVRHGNRLVEIDDKLLEHDARFDAVDRRFDAVDQRLDAVDQRLNAIDQRFEGVDRRFVSVDQRLEVIGRQVGEVLDILRAG